jgi:hypothetical protein
MFNPVIIVAIIIQALVAKANRIAGAVIGFLITTGIFLWGMSVYAAGNQIALFTIPLSQPVFLIACLVWYGFDIREFLLARKESQALSQVLNSPLLQNPNVVRFYQTTMQAWSEKKLTNLGKGFENEAKLAYDAFVKKYLPVEGGALHALFTRFPPLDDEYLVGLGNLNTATNGWFALTSQRLIQRDGRDKAFRAVNLVDVDNFQMKGTSAKTLIFRLKSGEEITFEKVLMYPTDKFLSAVINQAKL